MALQQVLHQLELATQGQGFTRLDRQINQWLRGTGLWQGMLHLTCLHTSCSLLVKLTYKNGANPSHCNRSASLPKRNRTHSGPIHVPQITEC